MPLAAINGARQALSNDSFARAAAPKPSATAGQNVFAYSGVIPGVPGGGAPSVVGRSYKIVADVTVPDGGGNNRQADVREGGPAQLFAEDRKAAADAIARASDQSEFARVGGSDPAPWRSSRAAPSHAGAARSAYTQPD